MDESWEEIGSRTAKGGFSNEDRVEKKFNNWEDDNEAKAWLVQMRYTLDEIDSVTVRKIGGRNKADILVTISLLDGNQNQERISCKKQNKNGYNHIGRNSVDFYSDKFGFTPVTRRGLKKFCGDTGHSPVELFDQGKITQKEYEQLKAIPQKRKKPAKEAKGGRFYFEELKEEEQKSILEDFKANLQKILNFIIRGEGEYQADWMLITKSIDGIHQYHLETVDESLMRAWGEVRKSKETKSSFRIGSITVQRKGGTGGATNLQFKWSNIFPE
ncbi:MAG: hypothetical protein ACFE7R_03640 [Candidatus Hodarchaeota archaeon]